MLERMRRLALLLVTVALAAGALAAGALAGGSSSAKPQAKPVDPQVALGAHLFVQFACSACHGFAGQGGVSTGVPPLKPFANQITAATLRRYINQGAGEPKDPTKVWMPVWGPVISDAQVVALVKYIKAGLPKVDYANPVAIPTSQGPVVAGMKAYQRYGCAVCHGLTGAGGVPNPASPTKAVPALAGLSKTYSNEALKEIVQHGVSLGGSAVISMPHWGGIIPDSQIDSIVAYLKTLE